ncbi:MAG: hypothetical protein KF901_05175 [Myxococcales bacterium]|nr:hypothetical protein [Myxococcales bacterium]
MIPELSTDHEVIGSYPERGFEIDRTRWPLVVVRIGRTLTPADLERYYERAIEEAERRQSRYVNVVDARALTAQSFSGVLRTLVTSFLRRYQRKHGGRLAAEVVVHDGFLARGRFAVIAHAYRPPWPFRLFPTLEEAERFALRVWRREQSGVLSVDVDDPKRREG